MRQLTDPDLTNVSPYQLAQALDTWRGVRWWHTLHR